MTIFVYGRLELKKRINLTIESYIFSFFDKKKSYIFSLLKEENKLAFETCGNLIEAIKNVTVKKIDSNQWSGDPIQSTYPFHSTVDSHQVYRESLFYFMMMMIGQCRRFHYYCRYYFWSRKRWYIMSRSSSIMFSTKEKEWRKEQ